MEPSAQPQPLKRSNAIIGKLQKDKVNPVSNGDWTAGSAKLSKALKYARKQDGKAEKRHGKNLEKASRQNSFEPSISDNASVDTGSEALPFGSYAVTHSKKPTSIGWSRTGATGTPAAKVPGGAKTKRWGIFGRKKEDSQRPVDNFTRWDGSDQKRRAYAASGSAGLMADALLGLANPSKESVIRSNDSEHVEDVQAHRTRESRHSSGENSLAEALFDNARLLQQLAEAEPGHQNVERRSPVHVQRKRQNRQIRPTPVPVQAGPLEIKDQQRAHPISIRDIDWSQTSYEQVRELLQPFEGDRHSNASPTDSGVDMGEGERPADKGKGRALPISSDGSFHSLIDYGGRLIEAEALRHLEDLELHKKHTLAEALEREYQRTRQEEEDARRARQLQEEERIARELQEEQARIAAELASRRDCICCSDTKHVLDFPAKAPTEQCEHTSTTCIDCMHVWLSSELTSKGCESLKCPECPSILPYNSVQILADEATFTKYEQLLLRNTLSSLPEFAWCLSPTCKSGQLNTLNGNYMEYDTSFGGCGYKQCLLHKIPWHAGETCTQYDPRVSGVKAAEEEAATQAILDEVSKVCPGKGCGWRIQKSDGCDHMTCRKCKWQFCWECLASHRQIKKEGNTAHQRWCKFHSENLERDGRGEVVVAWPFNAHA